jgi:hypothetical protein
MTATTAVRTDAVTVALNPLPAHVVTSLSLSYMPRTPASTICSV